MKFKVIKNIDTLIQPLKHDNPRLYEALQREMWVDVPLLGPVDRGDPLLPDRVVGDFITDGTWRMWNLSAIVPSGATYILLRLSCYSAAGAAIWFRKNGNENVSNADVVMPLEATAFTANVIVACDSNRIIEYLATNVVWTVLTVTVGGWG